MEGYVIRLSFAQRAVDDFVAAGATLGIECVSPPYSLPSVLVHLPAKRTMREIKELWAFLLDGKEAFVVTRLIVARATSRWADDVDTRAYANHLADSGNWPYIENSGPRSPSNETGVLTHTLPSSYSTEDDPTLVLRQDFQGLQMVLPFSCL
jgi:hypothetical protein